MLTGLDMCAGRMYMKLSLCNPDNKRPINSTIRLDFEEREREKKEGYRAEFNFVLESIW